MIDIKYREIYWRMDWLGIARDRAPLFDDRAEVFVTCAALPLPSLADGLADPQTDPLLADDEWCATVGRTYDWPDSALSKDWMPIRWP